ncbi:MAG: alpha/beta fold hydrolase [Armatimonadetes bacterium]|nr:alpha/beta fold hydrolase [Armatimonadota bacterium]
MTDRAVIDDFSLAGGDRGCLLLHGFTGSPLEMVPMAEALARDGLTVHVARLAGHGTSPEDLARTSWVDWVNSAREAYRALLRRCRVASVGGLSMGGAIALHLAATEAPAAAIAMATPVRLRPLVHRLARAARPVLPYAPVLMRMGPRSPEVIRYRASYPRIPLGALGDLSQLLDHTRELLPQIRVPVLVAQGRWDWAVPSDSADVITSSVASSVRRLVWLPGSGHLVTLDRDRAMLFDEVRRFLREHLPAA